MPEEIEKEKEEKEEEPSFDLKLTPKTKKLLIGLAVIVLVVFGGIYFFKNSSQEDEDPVVAVVNSDKIFLSQLEQAYITTNLNGQRVTKVEMLDMMIDQMILLQAIKAAGITVNKAEVDDTLGQLIEANGITEEIFYERAQQNGLSKAETFQLLEERVLIEKFYETRIIPRIEVTEEMGLEFYDENKDMFILPDAVNVSHVLVETEEEAESIKTQLDSGVEINSLAEQSIDPSAAENNGNLGYIVKGRTVPEFEQTAFSLAEDEISDPVQSQFGYHVIQVHKIEPSRHLEYKEVSEVVEQLLFNNQQQEIIQSTVNSIKEQSNIEINTELLEEEEE